jgi:hypothetical protein
LVFTANVVPSSPILVNLIVEALHSSGASVLARASRRNIPEDGILHSHRLENFKCYINKNKNVRDLYKGVNEFKMYYEPGNNVMKDENYDLIADSHKIKKKNGRTQ